MHCAEDQYASPSFWYVFTRRTVDDMLNLARFNVDVFNVALVATLRLLAMLRTEANWRPCEDTSCAT